MRILLVTVALLVALPGAAYAAKCDLTDQVGRS
jgi:hypothetical protein